MRFNAEHELAIQANPAMHEPLHLFQRRMRQNAIT
jgi:hypothetical protein